MVACARKAARTPAVYLCSRELQRRPGCRRRCAPRRRLFGALGRRAGNARARAARSGPRPTTVAARSRPFLRPVPSATTATPLAICTTWRRGHGLRLGRIEGLDLPPNTGQRATTATSIPGTFTSTRTGAAVHLGRRVEPPDAGAEDLPIFRILSGTSCGMEAVAASPQFAVGETPLAGRGGSRRRLAWHADLSTATSRLPRRRASRGPPPPPCGAGCKARTRGAAAVPCMRTSVGVRLVGGGAARIV